MCVELYEWCYTASSYSRSSLWTFVKFDAFVLFTDNIVLIYYREHNSPTFPYIVYDITAYKGGYTLVTLPRIVTPYRDLVDETRARVTYQKLVTR